MREFLFFSMIFMLVGCGGSLSEDQRKALKKEMGNREIKKVSEDEIFKVAMEMGREFRSKLAKFSADSVSQAEGIRVVFADSASTNLQPTHRSLWEAYSFSANTEEISENVQRAGDTIIYSSPQMVNGRLEGVWFINIPRKKIVLEL